MPVVYYYVENEVYYIRYIREGTVGSKNVLHRQDSLAFM